MLENNQIYLGDCLDLMQDIPDNSIDMILCDLPYGNTICKWDAIIPFDMLWKSYKRIAKENCAIVLFGNQPFTSLLICSNLQDYKYNWVWDKIRGGNFATVNKRPFNSFEDICVFYSQQCQYNPQKTEGKPYTRPQGGNLGESKPSMKKKDVVTVSDGMRYPLSILRFPKDKELLHPTQKPVALCEYLIKTYTNPDEVILDNCVGSGTTADACINTNRNFIGIEKDEKYYQIALNRVNKKRDLSNDNIIPI